MTTATATSILIAHKRGKYQYLTIDGTPARITNSWPYITLEVDYKNPKSEHYKSILLAPDRYIYRDDLREWDETADTYFYPYAEEDDADLFNTVMDLTA